MAIASFFLENEKAEKQSGVYRLRGMAVEPEMQSKGYGTICKLCCFYASVKRC